MSEFILVDIKPKLKGNHFDSLDEVVTHLKASLTTESCIAFDKEEKEIVFIITLEEPYLNNAIYTQFEGIELLKWLRLNRIYNHCILITFLPLLEVLQKNPNHNIVASKGTSFIQLPSKISFNKNAITPNYFYANEYELKQLFRVEIDIAKIRHEEANWWGLYRNILIKDAINKSTGKGSFEIPVAITKYLKTLNHKIADFIFIEDEAKITSVLNNQKVILKADEPYYIKNVRSTNLGLNVTLRQKCEYFEKALKEQKLKCLQIDDKASDGWSYLLMNIIYENADINLFETIEPNNEFDTIETIYLCIRR